MNLVNLESAVKAYGSRTPLDRVSLGVAAGERIGVVGRNGSGKTTLLAALAGTLELDSGRSTRSRGARIGYLPQSEQLSGTVRQIVFGALPEHEWAADARRRTLLAALLDGVDHGAAAQRLSGGERRRVALAALLLSAHDLLLLDEPTNHLDIWAIRWLADYLASHGKAFVAVTHDRWFLDASSQQTWEVADGQVYSYDGGYSAYVLARAERVRTAAADDQRRRNLLRKELAWLRRGPPARTSKPRFRLEAASALIADEPAPRDTVELAQLATARLGKTVIELDGVSVTAGQAGGPHDGTLAAVTAGGEPGRLLLDNVTWQLGPGDRVGVIGVNGSGKTTLLRVLSGRIAVPGSAGDGLSGGVGEPGSAGGVLSGGVGEPGSAGGVLSGGVGEPGSAGDVLSGGVGEPASAGGVLSAGIAGPGSAGTMIADGAMATGKTVRLGYLTQEPAAFDPGLRALEAAEQVRRSMRLGKREVSASQLLDRLGLRGDRQWTPVPELSGGEQRRLQLQLVLMAEPNVLLLDEPTNDLDIDTLTELEDLLDGFPGSIVVVSHDRYFLERVCDHVLALIDGRLAFLPGGVDDYLELCDQAQADGSGGAGPGGAGPGGAGPGGAGPGGAGPDRPLAERQRQAKKEIARLDRQLARLASQEADLHEALAQAASDYSRLMELNEQLRALHAEKESLEERWLVLADELSV